MGVHTCSGVRFICYNRLNGTSSMHQLLSPKELSLMLLLHFSLKGIFYWLKIQNTYKKRNIECKTQKFFYGGRHSFLPSGSQFELVLEDLQEESPRFFPHNSTVSICLTEAGVALDVYQWLCCNSVKGQGRFSADHTELYDGQLRVTANNLVGKKAPTFV